MCAYYAWLWIALSVPRKYVIVWFPHGVDRYVMSCLSAVSPKKYVPSINIVRSVFRLADRTLEKAFRDSGKQDLGLVSANSNGIDP